MKTQNDTIEREVKAVNDVLSSREAESYLKVSRDTLNRYCMNGIIPYSRPTSGKRYFFKNDLDNHIGKNRFVTLSDIQAKNQQ